MPGIVEPPNVPQVQSTTRNAAIAGGAVLGGGTQARVAAVAYGSRAPSEAGALAINQTPIGERVAGLISGADRANAVEAGLASSQDFEGDIEHDADVMLRREFEAKCAGMSDDEAVINYEHLCWAEICKSESKSHRSLVAETAVWQLCYTKVETGAHREAAFIDSISFELRDKIDVLRTRLREAREFEPAGERQIGADVVERQAQQIRDLCAADHEVKAVVENPRFGAFFTPRPASDTDNLVATSSGQRTLFDVFEFQSLAYQPRYAVNQRALNDPAFYKSLGDLLEAAWPAPMPMDHDIMVLAVTEAMRAYVMPVAEMGDVGRHILSAQMLEQHGVPRDVNQVIDNFAIATNLRDRFGILPK